MIIQLFRYPSSAHRESIPTMLHNSPRPLLLSPLNCPPPQISIVHHVGITNSKNYNNNPDLYDPCRIETKDSVAALAQCASSRSSKAPNVHLSRCEKAPKVTRTSLIEGKQRDRGDPQGWRQMRPSCSRRR